MTENFTEKERALIHWVLSSKASANVGSKIVTTVVLSAIFGFSSYQSSDLGMWIAFAMLILFAVYEVLQMHEWNPVTRSLFEKLKASGAFEEPKDSATD